MSRIILFADDARHLHALAGVLGLALADKGNEVLMVSPPGARVAALQALGLAWQPSATVAGGTWSWGPAGVLLALVRQLRRERPDLVHSFTTRGVLLGSIAARIARVPARINTLTGVAHAMGGGAGFMRRIAAPFRRVALRLALAGRDARVIVHGQADFAWLLASGCVDMARVRLIPSAPVTKAGGPGRVESAADARDDVELATG